MLKVARSPKEALWGQSRTSLALGTFGTISTMGKKARIKGSLEEQKEVLLLEQKGTPFWGG